MSYVWKRLTRVNKLAAKYRVLFQLQELVVEGTSKWQPNRLCVVLTRRNRRRCSQNMPWESTILNPYQGRVIWSLPEILDIEVTLFKGRSKEDHYESKEWLLSIEDISPPLNRPRRIASFPINISEYVDEQLGVPLIHEFNNVQLRVTSKKVKEVSISFMMHTQLLREGCANDADMQSMASLLSMKPDDPVPNLDDDDFPVAEHSAETSAQISELTSKFSELLQGNFDYDQQDSGLNHSDSSRSERVEQSCADPTPPPPAHVRSESYHELDLVNASDSRLVARSIEHLELIQATKSVEDVQAEAGHSQQQFRGRLLRTTSSLASFGLDSHNNHPAVDIESILNESERDHLAEERSNMNGLGSNRSSQSLSNIGSSGHSAESLEHFEPNPALTVNDLLNWCQEVTRGYRGVRITNLTTSWRNGMAFCAIIHHFRPDLIDFSSLRPVDVVDNCQKAFAVAERLGVPALINPDDMNTMSVPDKLSVMTYLYELRSYFTNAAQQQQQRTPNARKSLNFTDVVDEIGNSRASMEVQEKCLDLFTRLDDIEGTAFSPKLDVAGADGGKKSTLSTSTVAQLLDGYKLLTSKLISSSKNEQNEDNVSKSGSSSSSSSLNKLMTRKQLMNPFDSDSDDEGDSSIKYDSKESISMNNNNKNESQPIRKPLRYASQDGASGTSDSVNFMLHTSYSTSCFRSTNNIPPANISSSTRTEPNDPTSTTNTNNNGPVEIGPGLIDLSQSKVNRLHRTYSAPTYQTLLVDPRKRSQCREQELRERARRLLQSTRSSGGVSLSKSLSQEETDRQRALRERARKLIASARQGVMAGTINWSSSESPLSTHSNATTNSNNTPLMSPHNQFTFDINPTLNLEKPEANNQPTVSSEPAQDEGADDSKVKSEPLRKQEQKETSPGKQTPTQLDINNVTPEIIKQEFEMIEKQQQQIDKEAKILEKRLHKLMSIDGNKKLEEKLTQNWFILINKRNELVRKEMRLNILKKQLDLNERSEELNAELRNIMALEDSEKTAKQRAREEELLKELYQVVAKRDELERHLDTQEKAIEVDEMVENQTQGHLNLMDSADKNCVIQ